MPRPINVECPHCFSPLKLKSSASIGKKARCPKCSEPFVVEEMVEAVAQEKPGVADTGGDGHDDFAPAPQKVQRLPGPARRKLKKKKKRQPTYDDTDDYQTYGTTSEELDYIRAGGVTERKEDMGFIFWIIGGVTGGVVGTIIWLAVAMSTGMELGWIAWAVGGLVGLGVRIPARGSEAAGPGLTAATIAIGAILSAKIIMIMLIVAVLDGVTVQMAAADVFHPLDLLWFLFAGFTAYKVGASVEEE